MITEEVPKSYASNNSEQNKPILETKISRSKDGKFIIHRTIITCIKPVNYYKAIIENKETE